MPAPTTTAPDEGFTGLNGFLQLPGTRSALRIKDRGIEILGSIASRFHDDHAPSDGIANCREIVCATHSIAMKPSWPTPLPSGPRR